MTKHEKKLIEIAQDIQGNPQRNKKKESNIIRYPFLTKTDILINYKQIKHI